jgi:chemotaxis regulatin CheY-phosphate phosphatase CheZ
VLSANGIDLAAGIEALTLDQAAFEAREAWRQDFLDRLFYLMRKDAAAAARAETSASYRQAIEEIAIV